MVKSPILHWKSHLQNKILTVPDNSTVVAYLNRQGGTKFFQLCMRTHDLLTTADGLNLRIRASHLAGKDNVVTDALSRGWKIDHKEWSLSQVWADFVFDL